MTDDLAQGAAVVSVASALISGADQRTNHKSASVHGLPNGQMRTKRTTHIVRRPNRLSCSCRVSDGVATEPDVVPLLCAKRPERGRALYTSALFPSLTTCYPPTFYNGAGRSGVREILTGASGRHRVGLSALA